MSERDEDARMVEEALHCAETGSAGHWPTAAGFLAEEVYRLRAELAETRAAGDALADRAVRLDVAIRDRGVTTTVVPAVIYMNDEPERPRFMERNTEHTPQRCRAARAEENDR